MGNKILFVTNNNALNKSFGAEQRSNLLLKAFLANGFKVDLVYIGPEKDSYCPQIEGVNIAYWNNGTIWGISKLSRYLRLLTYKMFPTSRKLSKIIDGLEQQNNYDYIACRYIQFASLAGLHKYVHKLILDIDDLPAQSFSTNIATKNNNVTFIKSIYRRMMYRSMKNETFSWIKNCKACLFPNKKQAEEYKGIYFPNIPIMSCNKLDYLLGNKNILFVGRMDYSPNYLGMDAFISNCWDIIIQSEPNTKLLIAGKGLKGEFKKSWGSHKNVEILGFVDNILDFYNQGNIVISPIMAGAGTNIKVIEALSLGKTCVLSRFSIKGFEDVIEEYTNCMIYNNYNDCINKIIILLQDQELCEKIGKRAYNSVANKYSQEFLNKSLNKIIKQDSN